MGDNFHLATSDIEFLRCEILWRLRKARVIKWLENDSSEEIRGIADYLKFHMITLFPYSFTRKYKVSDVTVSRDQACGMIYTKRAGRKLYFKKSFSTPLRAKIYYKGLLMEQDPASPHRYCTDEICPDDGSVILDLGGAEGFFALDYIDKASHVYIFECDPYWIEALNKTYEKDRDKVTIINISVGKESDDTHICLNDFARQHHLLDKKLFIKMDIEGSEQDALIWAKELLETCSDIKLACCTYHRQEDEEGIKDILGDNFTIQVSDGYMFFYYDYNLKAPYLRRGVLRAVKKNGE